MSSGDLTSPQQQRTFIAAVSAASEELADYNSRYFTVKSGGRFSFS
jgi:hypothetical protein